MDSTDHRRRSGFTHGLRSSFASARELVRRRPRIMKTTRLSGINKISVRVLGAQ